MRKNSSFNHFVMLATAAVAMLMASCIKDEVVDVPFIPTESETIGFGINLENLDDTRAASRNRVGKYDLKSADGEFTLPMGVYVEDGIGCADAAETRGAKLDNGSTIESFTVWASLTGTNGQTSLFFPAEGEEFTKNDNNIFVSNPEHFWPGAGTIDFVAVANAPTSGFTPKLNSDGTALESFTYTVPDAAADQKDIVVAKPEDPVSGANNKSVPLNFKHIMSAVNFTVGEKVANGVIKSITINNIKTTGSYNVATGTWTPNTDGKGSYSAAFSSTDANGNYEPNDKPNGTIINDGACTFMMMPQVLDADAEVVVEFIYDNATSDVKQLRANIAIDPENPSQRREWAMGKTTYYSLSVDENYNLTITPKGDVLDAHYVMTDVTVNVDTETDQAWTLTVEATNIDSDDVSIEYKNNLNKLIKEEGYWIDKIIDGTTETTARGTKTVKGTTKGAHTITVFIPENITANERKITLTLSLDNVANAVKTEYLYQMCPYWDTNKGFGWERVENSEKGEYGFTWNRVVCYIFNHSFTTSISSEYSYFNNSVDALIEKYDPNNKYVKKLYYEQGTLGYRGVVIIDYGYFPQSDVYEFYDLNSGMTNTEEFFDISDALAFETALKSIVKRSNTSEYAFRIPLDGTEPDNNGTVDIDKQLKEWGFLSRPNTSYTDSQGVTHTKTWKSSSTMDDMSGILNYIIKRNAFNLIKQTADDYVYYTINMDKNSIKWYLPAVNQYKDPVLSFATGNTTFVPSNFWSSTACEDDNTSAYLGSGTPELRTEKKKVVVQRIVTPIPQPTTISEIDTEEMKGGENGEAQWVE